MVRKRKKYVLLHAHAYAGPGGKRSYLHYGIAKDKKKLRKKAKKMRLDGYRIAPKSKVKKTGKKLLWYVQ